MDVPDLSDANWTAILVALITLLFSLVVPRVLDIFKEKSVSKSGKEADRQQQIISAYVSLNTSLEQIVHVIHEFGLPTSLRDSMTAALQQNGLWFDESTISIAYEIQEKIVY